MGPKANRIIDLARKGHPPREIFTLLINDPVGASTIGAIKVVLSNARRDGFDIPKFEPVHGCAMDGIATVDLYELGDDFESLEAAALDRGRSVEQLTALIVRRAVKRGMIDAILDDAPTNRECA